jgi:hypothetical protein
VVGPRPSQEPCHKGTLENLVNVQTSIEAVRRKACRLILLSASRLAGTPAPDHFNGTIHVERHCFRNASHNHSVKSAAPMGTEYDQFRFPLFGFVQNRLKNPVSHDGYVRGYS